MDITFWVIVLVLLLDIAVFYDIAHSKRTQENKI